MRAPVHPRCSAEEYGKELAITTVKATVLELTARDMVAKVLEVMAQDTEELVEALDPPTLQAQDMVVTVLEAMDITEAQVAAAAPLEVPLVVRATAWA